jgi:hypothetical protein
MPIEIRSLNDLLAVNDTTSKIKIVGTTDTFNETLSLIQRALSLSFPKKNVSVSFVIGLNETPDTALNMLSSLQIVRYVFPKWFRVDGSLNISDHQTALGWSKEIRKDINIKFYGRYGYEYNKKPEANPQTSLFISSRIKIGAIPFFKLGFKQRPNKLKAWNAAMSKGFSFVISEIDQLKYDCEITTPDKINDYDVVLFSFASYLDSLNLVRILSKLDNIKPKIIIGGPGVLNIRWFKHLIDTAVFGRAEGLINSILDCEPSPSVWHRSIDPDISSTYSFRPATKLCKGELSVGCKRKCLFCQYSWLNKPFFTHSNSYTSGKNTIENFFDELNWEESKPGKIITAWDGLTEYSRAAVNKPMTDDFIINKLHEIYNTDPSKNFVVKIYMLAGYPFEKMSYGDPYSTIKKILKACDKSIKTHSIKLIFFTRHFIPMACTPLAYEGLNWFNFRSLIGTDYLFFNGINITAYHSIYTSPPSSACEAMFIQRAVEGDISLINFLFTRNYQRMNSVEKCAVLKEKMPKRIYSTLDMNSTLPTDFISTPFNFRRAASVYRSKNNNIVY